MQGVVTKSTGSWYTVKANDGIFHECRIKGKFRIQGIMSTSPIVVGDYVRVQKEADNWMIVDLYERKNYIVRKSVNLSKQKHIIAANIDQAIFVVTIQSPVTTTSFIDRFLASAKAYDINVVLLFNKLDIYSDEAMEEQKFLQSIYERLVTSAYHFLS